MIRQKNGQFWEPKNATQYSSSLQEQNCFLQKTALTEIITYIKLL